ncbi:MAG TPA: serine/threonine-protein kinase [Thermoanaerobaculaceae bacterium]|nr:serine/threonine-protein kinase [Thermoanaerobaculaceae bacterium]HRS14835.1 serine/threonine-protein kinase [Thermoanaerobaculaceae bacterium]
MGSVVEDMQIGSGSRLGGYTIIASIGSGGMGEVFRARDERLGREVAVKVIHTRAASDTEALALFEREARTLAALSHPNIMSIFDFGASGGHTYAVMELLEGSNLRQRMDGRALPWRTAVAVAMGVCRGLAAAHAKGVVHRDLKPENVFVQLDGQVKILDFGLAHLEVEALEPGPRRLGQDGFVGSKLYMAPEQICRRPVDSRTDIFAVGMLLYEMLAGSHPFPYLSVSETMAAILREDPRPLGSFGKVLPAPLVQLVHACLAKDPDRRPPTVLDVMLALGEVSLAPELPRPSATAWIERGLWFAMGLFAGVAAAGAAWLLLS